MPEWDTSGCSPAVVLAVTLPALVTLNEVSVAGVYRVAVEDEPMWKMNDCPLPVLNAFCKLPRMYLALLALESDPFVPSATELVPVVILPAVSVRLVFIVMLELRVRPVLLLVRMLNVVPPVTTCVPPPLNAK